MLSRQSLAAIFLLTCIGVSSHASERELPAGIDIFLSDVGAGKRQAGDGSSYVAEGVEEHLLETLGALLGAYDFKPARIWPVEDDCLLKLKAEEEKYVVVLSLRLTFVAGHWRLRGKPLMREIRLPGAKPVRGDTGSLRRQANKLRAEILVERAMLEGVEGFLRDVEEKYGGS